MPKRKSKRGWVLPGYRYLGPGNSLDRGTPTNESDAAARDHDIEYDRYIKSGYNPYTSYSTADDRFLKRARLTDAGGFIGKSFFYAKKAAAGLGAIGTLPDLPSGTQDKPDAMLKGGGAGSGNEGNQNETPVDIVANVHRGPPDYTFASLPWLERRTHYGEDYHTYSYIYRMTSPYDTFHDTSLVDTNAGAGVQNERVQVATDTNIRKARWFDYYAGLYNYYHVVSCNYHFMVENLSTEPMWVHYLFVNDDQPPLSATNDDIRSWKGVRSMYLAPIAYAVTALGAAEDVDDAFQGMLVENETLGNDQTGAKNYETGNHVAPRGPINICKITGQYTPGQHTREIHLDDDVETWTAVNTNPKLPERLCILIRPDTEFTQANGAPNSNRTLNYRLSQEIEYLTEFKELKNELRYPVTRQPLTVNISADVVTAL